MKRKPIFLRTPIILEPLETKFGRYRNNSNFIKLYWKNYLRKLKGQPLIITNRREKKIPTYVAIVLEVYENHAVFQYKTFDSKGKFRGYQTISLNYHSLFCGEDSVVVLD